MKISFNAKVQQLEYLPQPKRNRTKPAQLQGPDIFHLRKNNKDQGNYYLLLNQGSMGIRAVNLGPALKVEKLTWDGINEKYPYSYLDINVSHVPVSQYIYPLQKSK